MQSLSGKTILFHVTEGRTSNDSECDEDSVRFCSGLPESRRRRPLRSLSRIPSSSPPITSTSFSSSSLRAESAGEQLRVQLLIRFSALNALPFAEVMLVGHKFLLTGLNADPL